MGTRHLAPMSAVFLSCACAFDSGGLGEIGRSDNYVPNGLVDEVRVYSEALSSGWIALEHANLNDPDFIDVGAEQTGP